MELLGLNNQIGSAPLSPRALDWDCLRDDFTRQCQKPYFQQILDFEQRLSDYLDYGPLVALNSGTSALHLALQVLDIKAGDTVLCSDFTFVASANPIRYVGATPVFIDCEASSWNMDPNLLELAIKELVQKKQKPKAIVLVHIYGNPARIEPILDIATSYNIPLIEDAAQAFGSEYRHQKVGTLGTLGVFSFNNNKLFSTLGGGALVSKNQNIIEKARYLASQAKEPCDYYYHQKVGYNYIISPLNASLGYAGLPFVDKTISEQRKAYEESRNSLNISPGLKNQCELPGASANRWATVVTCDSESHREKVQATFNNCGYETRRLWKPLRTQPIYNTNLSYSNGIADQLFNKGLCLPSIGKWNLEQMIKVS